MATNIELEKQVSALRAELETVKQATGAAEVEALKAEVVELKAALDRMFGSRAFALETRKEWTNAKKGASESPIRSSALPGLPAGLIP